MRTNGLLRAPGSSAAFWTSMTLANTVHLPARALPAAAARYASGQSKRARMAAAPVDSRLITGSAGNNVTDSTSASTRVELYLGSQAARGRNVTDSPLMGDSVRKSPKHRPFRRPAQPRTFSTALLLDRGCRRDHWEGL